MPRIPQDIITRENVEQALEVLTKSRDGFGKHKSKLYDLLWKGHRFPPKIVVSKAFEMVGQVLPEVKFSSGWAKGQAFQVLEDLGFEIVER